MTTTVMATTVMATVTATLAAVFGTVCAPTSMMPCGFAHLHIRIRILHIRIRILKVSSRGKSRDGDYQT
jgi:hypothetical protein